MPSKPLISETSILCFRGSLAFHSGGCLSINCQACCMRGSTQAVAHIVLGAQATTLFVHLPNLLNVNCCFAMHAANWLPVGTECITRLATVLYLAMRAVACAQEELAREQNGVCLVPCPLFQLICLVRGCMPGQSAWHAVAVTRG